MTIMELLVGAGIALFVMGSVFAAVRVQGRSAAFQNGLADAQVTSRGSGELLLQDLRMAGFGMLGLSPTDADTYPPLSVAVDGAKTTLILRGAFDNVTTTLAGSAAKNDTQLIVNTPASGGFVKDNLVLVDSGLSAEVFVIQAVAANGGGTDKITISGPLKNDYPLGPFVTQLEVVTYIYEPQGSTKFLRRNGQVVAENVPIFSLTYVDDKNVESATPGTTVRSVKVNFEAAEPAPLPGNPTARSKVVTEANMRNLAFRYEL